MKKFLVLLACIILVFGVVQSKNTQAEDAEKVRDLVLKGIPLDVTECEHAWQKEIASKRSNSVSYRVQRQQTVDIGDYHVIYSYIMNECVLCGVQQELPDTREEQHLYVVKQYVAEENDPDTVRITYQCELCEHVRTEIVLLSKLASQEEASKKVDCRHGGDCPTVGEYVEVANGLKVSYNDRVWYLTRVMVSENGSDVWKVARRLECWACRRPVMQVRTEIDAEWEDYNKLPAMTYEEFMTEERTNLPYQLIDDLRKQTETV